LSDANRQRTISIIAFPRKGNGYVNCFYDAVEALGVEVREGHFSCLWLLKHLRNADFIHLHWPSYFYAAPQRRKSLRGFAVFLFFLMLARWRGVRLLWTAHNIYPHDRCVIPQLDSLARRLLVRLSALVFVHCSCAQADARREFPSLAGRIVRIHHGHWIGYYPNTIARGPARSMLGLPQNEFLFLFLGLCRPYKNLESLIHAFEQLPGKPLLLIAGMFQDAAYESAIKAVIDRSQALRRITLYSGFVPDEDLQIYLRACNVVVTPYREILTSGSAILALSFGRPVIAPAIGCLQELIVNGCGLLYDPSPQSAGLRDAMQASMDATFDEARIMSEASKLDWRQSAKIFVNALRDVPIQKDSSTNLRSSALETSDATGTAETDYEHLVVRTAALSQARSRGPNR
jgi:beta-1,4-mannosyltransferase